MVRWRGHRLWTSAVLAAGLGLGGCAATERPTYAGAPPDFVALLNLPGEQVQRGWVRKFIAMEYRRTRIEPHLSRIGHLQIAAYYQGHPEEFKVDDTVVWQDLFIAAVKHPSRDAARSFAESLIARAQS